jgi:hypothetical protein
MEKESFERSMRELDKVLDLYIDKYNACKDGDVECIKTCGCNTVWRYNKK